MRDETKPTGTQSIERAIHLMKLLAKRGRFGWGLTDLSRSSGLDKATVHRILTCLDQHRLVEQDAHNHRYFPGPLLVELGMSVSNYRGFLQAGQSVISQLARRTGGVSFFYLRSGTDFVVAGRVEQSAHPGMINDVGYRRPLIMSAGGVAILLAMSEQERDAAVARNMAELAASEIPKPERFMQMLERSLALGYSANLGDVALGINSFSMPILDQAGAPIGSLSLAGDAHRFSPASGRKFADLLSFEAKELSAFAPGSCGEVNHLVPELTGAL